MCGIAGFVDFREPLLRGASAVVAQKMAVQLAARGPDAEGLWSDNDITLIHRRLAIIDLSQSGAQPMISKNGRLVIVFNGEIYNHQELREELVGSGFAFRGRSDTEVLLESIAQFGIEAGLRRSVGMFALAVWDRRDKTLYLARDRMGEKPLYFGWCGSAFLFASQLGALRPHPKWTGEINRAALTQFLKYGYVPTPLSIYAGIAKLEPGTIRQVSLAQAAPGCELASTQYWSWPVGPRDGGSRPQSIEAAAEELAPLLQRSVKRQLVADVPVGAFLSGGVDSSLVVLAATQASATAVKTFTIGFHHRKFDESPHAEAVAKHLGTDHTSVYLEEADLLNAIPNLPTAFDEPFGDPSQIPTSLVAQIARRKVTVALSGDGGDELFGGYDRYAFCLKLWTRMQRVPAFVRQNLTPWIGRRCFGNGLASLDRYPRGGLLQKLSKICSLDEFITFYDFMVSHWKNPETIVVGSGHGIPGLTPVPRHADAVAQMMLFDSVRYLCDDILVKVDRASMAVGLEARAPFLDHHIVEFAWNLPMHLRWTGVTKAILRQLLQKQFPAGFFERSKQGFSLPLADWLRGALRPWAEEMLHPDRLRREGFFDPECIQLKWDEHVSKRRNWHVLLWDVLMFQTWLASIQKSAA